jgi:signal peptidase II
VTLAQDATSEPTAPAAAPVQRAVSGATVRPDGRAIAIRLGVVALLLVLDLWSKAAVFAWLERLDHAGQLVYDDCGHAHARHHLIDGWLTFMLSLNPGAAFGQLDKWPWLLVCGRVFAALFLTWLLVRTPRGKPVLVTAFVLVLAGALGNLYDNLLRARDLELDRLYTGRTFMPVRDFIDVYFSVWQWHFPTFNVADSCITIGAILLLATSFFRRRPA